MFPAARILDPITHDLLCPSGIIGPGVPVPCPLCAAAPVIIEGMPAAHVLCSAVCTGVISAGLAHPPPPRRRRLHRSSRDRQRCSSTGCPLPDGFRRPTSQAAAYCSAIPNWLPPARC